MRFGILIILMITSTLCFGQNRSIGGVVRDSETNDPLAFAAVAISGKSSGTIANEEGIFRLANNLISSNDTLLFSFIGYKTTKIPATDLIDYQEVLLQPAAINLNEVPVYARQLTAEEIVQTAKERFTQNHPSLNGTSRLFFHKYERTPWSPDNRIMVKESDFVGMDEELINDILSEIPDEFIEYQDAIFQLHKKGDASKLHSEEAISMEEGSQEEMMKEMESRLSEFFEDIELTRKDEDLYYKFRTGIFAFKDKSDEPDESPFDEDSSHYKVKTTYVKGELMRILNDNTSEEGKNLEFLFDMKKYEYERVELTAFNDELVYHISFRPEKKGLFLGNMYISVTTFGLVQIDFEFAPEKQDEVFNLLGVGHSINFKKGKVIFEKQNSIYCPRYIHFQQNETASIERDFKIMKKRKRFLWDKSLNEVEFSTDITFDMNSIYELLILDRTDLEKPFEDIEEPGTIKFKREFAYSPEMWQNGTILVPTKELENFTRSR